MLQFFRSMFKSKIGLAVALVFLGIIALAFASADISSTGTFGGVAGGDRVAVVGDERIGTADLTRVAQNGLDRARAEQDPTISMPAFIAGGGLEEAMETLIDRFAIRGYARNHGLRAGENLVNSEIRSIPAFRGADGNFSEDSYRQVLAQQRLSDAQVREDLRVGLIAQQLLIPASFGTTLPDSIALRYAQLLKERRQGAIGLLPSAAYAPSGAPTSAQIQAFYNDNRGLFIRPERRVIRFLTFDSAALGASIEPTAAEIAARYKRDAAQYAASEERSLTQLIVPTEAAARSIRERVEEGASFEQVASDAGLRTSALESLDRAALRNQASEAVASAYFSAPEGAITTPARSPLGWHIARVDAVNREGARTLEQVSDEIADALREEKRVRGLAELAIGVEEQIDEGATLAEIARGMNLSPQVTRPLIANGQIYGVAGETAPPVLAPALATAFQMDEEEPEVAALQNGEQYLLFEVSDITPSAAAPLAQIRETVVSAWRQAEGAKAARAAADRVLARLRQGETLAAAVAGESVDLPSVDPINLTREDLANQRERRIPAPLALMFSMAEGTAKKLEAGGKQGWFVVDLDTIDLDPIAPNDPLIAQAKQQLGSQLGQEYIAQLRTAIREELGVERNESAIEAVRKQLAGGN